jgi:MFS transporter, FHS family, L-fucose permease
MEGAGKTYRTAAILIVALFAIWGLAHRLYDTLLPEFAAALSLNSYEADLAQWMLSLGYFLMPLPAALLTRNFGYKSGVIFGLGCFAVGMFLFYPAAERHGLFIFLSAALVTGSGLCLLEVAADPLVVRMGPIASAVRRLNIAQALNPVGILVGLFAGRWVMQSVLQHPVAQLAHVLVLPYFAIGAGVLLIAFVVDNVAFPPVAGERVAKNDRTHDSFVRLLKQRLFLYGAGAQALCSVAQLILWGFTVRYALQAVPGAASDFASSVLLWSLVAFTIGRVVGTALMYRFDPSWLLAIFAAGGAVLAAVSAFAGGYQGVYCIVGASFFLSIVFPTIFGNTIRDLGPQTKSGAALLMLAAGTGAAVLAIVNLLTGPAAVQYVMLVPSACFAAIAVFAVVYYRATESGQGIAEAQAIDPSRRLAE